MRTLLACAFLVSLGSPSLAAAPAPARARYALFRLDPLGIAPEIVAQLERLLRIELERVVGQPLPSRAEVDRAALASPQLAECTADPACLAPLARALNATRIVAGNVGGLADSYVVNLKLVDSDGRELRRVAATLRGSPEELIDEVRVAAYRLVAPEKLVGAIAILSEVPGATVMLDGAAVGQTPLMGPLAGLSVGVHKLAVERPGFSPFEEDVPVRYEKTTQVVVRQRAVTEAARRELERRAPEGRKPIYARWYFWTGLAVVTVGVAVGIGFAIPKQDVTRCAPGRTCP
ncbi:MAG TPA: PEGA domain-containing protein [Polyangia bacterium]|nr:PEGA domain-containing protein [Polyangia bacterium]